MDKKIATKVLLQMGAKNFKLRENLETSTVDISVCSDIFEEKYAYELQKKQYLQQSKIVNNYLNKIANMFQYDSMLSARSYAGFDNKYKDEATKLAKFSSECWEKFEDYTRDVAIVEKDILSEKELLNMLPNFNGSSIK
jgi:hypothetical protein